MLWTRLPHHLFRSKLRAGSAAVAAGALISASLLAVAPPASANGNCVTYWQNA